MKKLASLLLAGGLATAVWAAPQAGTSAGTPATGAGAQAGSKTAGSSATSTKSKGKKHRGKHHKGAQGTTGATQTN